MDWAASSICGLYQSRWAIEVFFKQGFLKKVELKSRHNFSYGFGSYICEL
jgi:hypothetical protein